MKFVIERKYLLKPLQKVISVIEGRIKLPILSNILLQVKKGYLLITTTDLEIEIVARLALKNDHEPGATTVSARKFFDICRCLTEGADLSVILEGERILIYSERSRYSLSTLPALEFPNLDNWSINLEFTLAQSILKQSIESVQFSMAYQDVRYYLNGMLLETEGKELRTIATDGHRLAICSIPMDMELSPCSVILPRKGVIELLRMLDNSKNHLNLKIGSNNICVNIGNYIFTSKLVDGHFPDYRRVLPKNPDKILKADCTLLKQAFIRVAILSNEKFRGVRLYISKNQLKISTNNSAQEEAEEIIDVFYHDDDIEISFNVNYILDVLNTLKCKEVRLLLTDGESGIQIEDSANQMAIYVVMPMRF